MTVLVFLAVVLLIITVWNLSIRFGLKTMSCSRKFSSPAVFEGDEGELIEVVRNDRSFMIPWLRVESHISPYLRLGAQDNLHVSGEMYYCSLFTLMPYQQIRRRHRVRFLRRGAYDLGSAALTAGDMLGFFRFSRTQQLSAPVLVYPRLLDRNELPMPAYRMLGEMIQRQQLLQDPFLIRGLRPYQPGDPVRDIHWPATARTGEVHVQVREYTARTRLLVILNVQYQEFQWQDYVPDEEAMPVEEEIRLAASLCVHALRDGLAAGFAANMPVEPQSKEITLMLPNDGAAWEEELLTAFARLNIYRAMYFPALLEMLSAYSDMDMLVISRYDSENIQNKIQKLRQSGNQVTFYQLQGGTV